MDTPDDDLTTIEAEGRRIIGLGREAPDAVVPQYPTWTLTDLVLHVGGVHGRTVTVCRERPRERVPTAVPPDGADPFEWAGRQIDAMIDGLRSADPDTEVWTPGDDPTISFWQRRMVIETGVHRWDAEGAMGVPRPLLDVVATHGLDEFAGFYLPRLGDPPSIELLATDLGRTWRFGAGEPSATIRDTASELYLRLMSRPGASLPDSWERAVDELSPPAKQGSTSPSSR